MRPRPGGARLGAFQASATAPFGRGDVAEFPKTSDIIWQDTQHRALFATLDLMAQPGANQEVLQRLRNYVNTHFALEEEYMRLLDYPGLERHIEAHRRFQDEVESLFHTDDATAPEFLPAASTFLTEWFTRHVLGIDKELEAFILASESK
jgi:hemerythrin